MPQYGKFSFLMLAGLVLLVAFLFNFFSVAGMPGYWHTGEIGSYLTHSFFIIDKGFFAEIPYWHNGYGLVLSALYQPLFFLTNLVLFNAFSLLGFPSIYWSYAFTIMFSFIFAFAATWKISKRNSLVFLLTMGNMVSLGLLVLTGIVTKVFAFNIAFPGIIYLLEHRKKLEMTRKEIAAFSLLLAAVFASHLYVFLMLLILYLGVLLQNRRAWLRGLIPIAMVPVLTLPYIVRFVPAFFDVASTTPIEAIPLGLSLNFFMATFVAFLVLFAIVRELYLLPLAGVAAVFALNLNGFIPLVSSMRGNFTILFFIAIIFYYLLNYDFAKAFKIKARFPNWLTRESFLVMLLFFLLVFNFTYYAPRIASQNLFSNSEYKDLLEFGELESVYFVADLAEDRDPMLKNFIVFQTFRFRNYTVNAWFPLGKSHIEFSKDEAVLVEALREGNCPKILEMVEKMNLKTLLVKNWNQGIECGLVEQAKIGNFTVLKAS